MNRFYGIAVLSVFVYAQSDLLQLTLQRELDGPVVAVAFSHESARVALIRSGHAWVGPTDSQTLKDVGAVPGSSTPAAAISRSGDQAAFSSGSDVLFVSDSDGAARVDAGAPVRSLCFAPDGSLVVAALPKAVAIFSTATRQPVRSLRNPSGKPLIYAGFRASTGCVVAVAAGGQVFEWDGSRSTILRQFQDAERTVSAAAVNEAGNLLLLATEYNALPKGNPFRETHPADFYREYRIKIYDLNKGVLAKQIDGINGQIVSFSVSPDNRFVAAHRITVTRGAISVYDLQRGVEVASLDDAPVKSSTAAAPSAVFSPDGKWLTAPSAGGALRLMAVRGIGRGNDAGDLAGVRIRLTSNSAEPLISPSAETIIAVMDLDALGTERSTGRTVADMIRNRLAPVPHLRLVERARMQQILTEQNFQNSDRADLHTAVRLGRLLGARKMIIGGVSRLGTTFTINVQLVDVETAGLDGVREVLCQRCTEEDLPAAVAEMSAALVR
jgi:hypothetical protein